MSPWRKPSAQHDPGKVILDLALSLAVGGDCLVNIANLREQPAVFGPVASDATVSRLITGLAADGPAALSAINAARAAAEEPRGRMPEFMHLTTTSMRSDHWSSTSTPLS